mgnify:CR=1 FL=1
MRLRLQPSRRRAPLGEARPSHADAFAAGDASLPSLRRLVHLDLPGPRLRRHLLFPLRRTARGAAAVLPRVPVRTAIRRRLEVCTAAAVAAPVSTVVTAFASRWRPRGAVGRASDVQSL